jgi:hypothetical protein
LFHCVTQKNTRLVGLSVALLLTAAIAYAKSSDNAAEAAQQQIKAIEGSEKKEIAREPVDKANDALKRAANARASQDERHAALLEALALEWAGTGSELLRSAELENKAAELEKQARETEAKAVRAVAIIEEAVARKGRAKLELEQQGSKASGPAPKEQKK